MKEETIVDIYDQATRLIEDLRVLCDIIDSAEPALPVESQYNPVPFPVTKYDGETMRNISAGEHLSTELAGARTGECAPMSDTDRGLIRSAGSTNAAERDVKVKVATAEASVGAVPLDVHLPAPAAPSTAAQEAAGTTERSPALPVDIVAKNARGYCIDRHGRECSNSQCYERGCERDRTAAPTISLEAWLVALCEERLTDDELLWVLENTFDDDASIRQHDADFAKMRTGIAAALTGRTK